MSHPPEYPGRDRLKRASARAGSDAYQGAFEAVGAVLLSCGVGFFVDARWETAPWGVLIGAVIGFAAMVLRLVRLGRELHPDDAGAGTADDIQDSSGGARLDRRSDDGPGAGVALGMSDALREDEESAAPQPERPAKPGAPAEEERRE